MDKLTKQEVIDLASAAQGLRQIGISTAERSTHLEQITRIKRAHADETLTLFKPAVYETIARENWIGVAFYCGQFINELHIFGKYVGVANKDWETAVNFDKEMHEARMKVEMERIYDARGAVGCAVL